MAGKHACQLLTAEPLEIARCGHVPLAAIGLGQVLVGDLAHQGLHELVLAALRGAGIGLDGEQLATDQPVETIGQVRRHYPRDGGQGVNGEALSQDRCVQQQPAVLRPVGVEPRCDQRLQRLRHAELG